MKITVQLQGGLGNQLFQYASAKNFAIARAQELLIDDIWYTKNHPDTTPRTVSLGYLNIPLAIGRSPQWLERPRKTRLRLQHFLPITPFLIAETRPFRFDPHKFSNPLIFGRDCYLIGYWQSFHYFQSIRSVLLTEFVPRAPLRPTYQSMLEAIQRAPSSCMVHIRRGDYVSLPQAHQVHGVLSLEYYRAAMDRMRHHLPNVQFFIFSDDLPWVREHLIVPGNASFVEGFSDDRAVVEELFLMTQCQNHIIANSSLSWWGAWLCQAPQQTVICPDQWLRDSKGTNWGDLLPSNWQRLSQ